MKDWSSGYVSDVEYTFGFYRDLTPKMLDLIALIKGNYSPDPSSKLSYCELGCGQGVSANIFAAANPHIQFHAVDFNPSQITRARMLAHEASLGNVHFYEKSFADLANEPGLPEGFDIIVLHGIYSWISSENRAAIVDFMGQRLKANGLVYVSYNALPGQAAVMPLRQLFVEHADNDRGGLIARIDAALNFAVRVQLANAKYFVANPSAVERLNKLKSSGRNYLAHEYFNRDWAPFYAKDVFADLAGAKLNFVGSASIIEQLDVINLTSEQQQIIHDVADVGLQQTLKDYFINQGFRRDVFQKGAVAMPRRISHELWMRQRFVVSAKKDLLLSPIQGVLGEAALTHEIYAQLTSALAAGPKPLREMIGAVEIDQALWKRILQAIMVLVGAGRIEPCLSVDNEIDRERGTRAFNQVVMRRALESDDLSYLASPVTGGGVPVPRFELLMLVARESGINTADGCARFVGDLLSAQAQGIGRAGVALQTAEESHAVMLAEAQDFIDMRLPVLTNLKVV